MKFQQILYFLSSTLLILLLILTPSNLIGDEPVYILEGDRYLHTIGQKDAWYYNSGSPPLLKILSGIPLTILPLDRNYEQYFDGTKTRTDNVADYVYVQNTKYAEKITFLARIPHAILFSIFLCTLYLFTKNHFNKKIAVISTLLLLTQPLILSHIPTANIDIGTTAFIFFAIVASTKLIYSAKNSKKIPISAFLLAGITLGLAQLTKISAILLYPYYILLIFISLRSFTLYLRLATLTKVIGISLLTMWTVYGFQIGPIIHASQDPAGIESTYGSLPIIKNYKAQITEFLSQPYFPLGAYFDNFTYQLTHSFYGHHTYLLGEFSDQKNPLFIPISFVLKSSIFFLAIIIISIFGLRHIPHDKWSDIFPFALWTILMIVWSATSKLQLGTRYIMPLYPTLMICIACAVFYWANTHGKKTVLNAVIILSVVSVSITYPNFFSYRNELARIANPITQIADSDFDWGQNIDKIAEHQQKNNINPLYLKSYGPANHQYYKIKTEDTLENAFANKKIGYYAFSHSALVNDKKNNPDIFSYFATKTPTSIIGDNIYIYYVQNW